jgi:hypothetical protein
MAKHLSIAVRRAILGMLLVSGYVIGAIFPVVPAYACGGFFDVECNLQNGGLSPGNIGNQVKKAGQDLANAVNELQASTLTGPTLEQAIVSSHNTAVNGAMPIPPNIRQQLTGYASEDSMNRVKYKIGDPGFANLAHVIEQANGNVAAVTLIDVIIFRGPSEAQIPSLWAHELTHVDQYRDWGVHSFAVQYARNPNSVEDPAYAKEHGYATWAQQRSQLAPQPPPLIIAQPAPGFGNFCYIAASRFTAPGRFGPGPILPIGSQCFVQTPRGPILGQIGP